MFAPLIMSGGSAMEGWPGNRRQDTNEHHLLFLYSNGRYRIVKCLYIYIYCKIGGFRFQTMIGALLAVILEF